MNTGFEHIYLYVHYIKKTHKNTEFEHIYLYVGPVWIANLVSTCTHIFRKSF